MSPEVSPSTSTEIRRWYRHALLLPSPDPCMFLRQSAQLVCCGSLAAASGLSPMLDQQLGKLASLLGSYFSLYQIRDTLGRVHMMMTFISPGMGSPTCSPLTKRLKTPLVLVCILLLEMPEEPLESSSASLLRGLVLMASGVCCLNIDTLVLIMFSLLTRRLSNLDGVCLLRMKAHR